MEQWKSITTEQDLDAIIELSASKPQIIFKDSLTCGISAYAKERLKNGYALFAEKADFNYLDLLSFRSVSNKIAQVLGVTHQSPQIIILKDKKVSYTASHHAIQAADIAAHLG